jgi:DnaJ-class molecular chaperone
VTDEVSECKACHGSGLEGYDPDGDGLYKAAKPCPICMGEGTDG